ncbi:MAG: deoxyribodipyrimidine photo-lyase [Dokdonella sp.]
MTTAIVWFRRDLRLTDNPALRAALQAHQRVLPVYLHAPDEEAPWQPGAASRWWLHQSLTALDATLRKCGARLHIAAGATLPALRRLIVATQADAVYWNRLYEPAVIARDTVIKEALRNDGLDVHSFNANLLFEPWEIATAQDTPYKVFTPFWRTARARLQERPPLPPPRRIEGIELADALPLDRLGLQPKIAWDKGFHAVWQPGEAGAARKLREFCTEAIGDYSAARDLPDRVGTSQLSPHLHFGEISPMQIAWALHQQAHSARQQAGAQKFMSEIGWREFSHHLLYHFPQTAQKNLNPRFDHFGWAVDDEVLLQRWQRGRTGIPIVDAGMRQLWATGWMHNRVRMLVASFLTKNLGQHWLHGARWFWDTLVDADLAANTQGWQWTAGSGADAAPYFRIFNPVTQGEKFDANGDYVRRWVPELRSLAADEIQQPWRVAGGLQRCGYPPPMVDLAVSRARALTAYQATAQR